MGKEKRKKGIIDFGSNPSRKDVEAIGEAIVRLAAINTARVNAAHIEAVTNTSLKVRRVLPKGVEPNDGEFPSSGAIRLKEENGQLKVSGTNLDSLRVSILGTASQEEFERIEKALRAAGVKVVN